MLHIAGFWEKEKGAPLFGLEQGFLEAAGERAFERATGWAATAAAAFEGERPKLPADDGKSEMEIPRIVTADAERTFADPDNRRKLARFLTRVNVAFGGDYSQSLGYVASLLVLFADEEAAFNALVAINSCPKYIPGYWKHEAIDLGTDSYVFGHLLNTVNPKVANHLQAACVLPETYCQKWFSGLCIHVLPFAPLFDFMDGFVDGGFRFSMQFGLSLMKELEQRILSTPATDVQRLYGLLRLDTKLIGDVDYAAIIKGAEEFKDVAAAPDYTKLRAEMYDKHLRRRVEASRKRKEEEENESDDEIVFSDEEDEDAK